MAHQVKEIVYFQYASEFSICFRFSHFRIPRTNHMQFYIPLPYLLVGAIFTNHVDDDDDDDENDNKNFECFPPIPFHMILL